jgi:hypothetical protein
MVQADDDALKRATHHYRPDGMPLWRVKQLERAARRAARLAARR